MSWGLANQSSGALNQAPDKMTKLPSLQRKLAISPCKFVMSRDKPFKVHLKIVTFRREMEPEPTRLAA
jgi:hypothetical protein